MCKIVYALDVGTDGRIEDQIRALSVQTILDCMSLVYGATAEDIASFYVFPEKRK